jgi:NDP-4-keto-2,6-dideoxyhexose 3-C-methyltransferase
MIKARIACRVCDGQLDSVLSLGEQYVSDFVTPSTPDGIKAPLDLMLCKRCTLLQLRHTVPADAMYQNYWYRSGTNQTMRNALADIANTAEQTVGLCAGDVVLDIGCNDGTLLSSYKTEGICRVGFDPAENLASLSRRVADRIYRDFFTAEKYTGFYKPKIVTSIAMFYDLEDPNKFVSDVKKVMDPDGVWILQMSYLPAMLKQHDFGNICHEHLEYYSLYSLEILLNRHGMVVSDVRINNVNGGSFRVFIRNQGSNFYNDLANDRVEVMRMQEAKMGLDTPQIYLEFVNQIERIKKDVFLFIEQQVRQGKKVAVYGASTKGNAMLQYFGLDNKLISFASERNSEKWGLVTTGTRIPIISEEDARARHPDFFLVLPWHFLEEFREREKKYLFSGGKFIVPLPHFMLI